MGTAELLSFQNSTTDRSTRPRIPAVLRATLGALGRLAPGAAARAAERRFLTTHRRAVPPSERRWVRSVTPTSFPVGERAVRGWVRGDGPAVLLVHGWSGRGSHLGAFIDPLVASGYRVVGYDAPGHGATDGRTSSLPEMADAVEAVGRRVGPLAGIVAHSLGAAASTVALRRGLAAERCVYLAPPSRVSRFPVEFCDALGFGEEVGRRLRSRLERRFDVPFEWLDGAWLAGRFAVPPLLIVHDRNDPDVPFSEGEDLASAWPGATLLATEGLGHRAIRRRREVVERAVRFLTEGSRRSMESEKAAG